MIYVNNCKHISHLFDNPLCPSQSLVRRIVNVVFHILTLGIPFIVYHMMKCCCKHDDQGRRMSLTPPPSPLPDPGLVSPPIIQPKFRRESELKFPIYDGVHIHDINALGEENVFLDFAQMLLEKYPEIQDCDWSKEQNHCPDAHNKPLKHLPRNQDICRLIGIMRGPLWENLIQALKENTTEDAWGKEEVLKAADMLLQTSMAIFILTQSDLPGIIHPKTGDGLDRIFFTGSYYQNRAGYYVWELYTLFKAGITWDAANQVLVYPEENTQNVRIASKRKFLFLNYKMLPVIFPYGLCQAKWQKWFNIYCKQFENYLKRDPYCFGFTNWRPREDTVTGVFQGKDSFIATSIHDNTNIVQHGNSLSLAKLFKKISRL